MIVVKLELWPRGLESKKRPLGEIRIINDGSGSLEAGNYDIELMHSGKYVSRKGVWKRGRVQDFLRKLSPYELLRRGLNNVLECKKRHRPMPPAPSLTVGSGEMI